MVYGKGTLLLAGFSLIASAAGAQSAPAAPPTQPAPSKLKTQAAQDFVPPPAKEDRTWRRLAELIPSGVGDRASPEARAALENTLRSRPRIPGANVGPSRCKQGTGCIADVDYQTVQAFDDFDKGRYGPGTAFERWNGSNGRTGLLKDGQRKFATWYFLVPKKGKGGSMGAAGVIPAATRTDATSAAGMDRVKVQAAPSGEVKAAAKPARAEKDPEPSVEKKPEKEKK